MRGFWELEACFFDRRVQCYNFLNWDTSARYGRAMVRLLFRLRDLGASRGEAHQSI